MKTKSKKRSKEVLTTWALAALSACDRMDTEEGHIEADCVLCGLLMELGYENVVNRYQTIKKWYA